MFEYPNKLNKIFDKLDKFNIKAIIVGGYVRDKILNIDSKDIDIELYGVNSFQTLENILKEFGTLNNVGKSFGVLKLQYEDLELDISLPRRDSKISIGHKGFKISTEKNLSFKEAASRRDFTINALGYDVKEKKLLDPFHGLKDLQKSMLKAVHLDKFAEDPLRVLRAVQFSARFHFKLDIELFSLCKEMVYLKVLEELPPERIYTELEKLFLKSKHPSLGLQLLKDLGAFSFFGKLTNFEAIDYYARKKKDDVKIDMLIFFALLYEEEDLCFLERVRGEKSLLKNIKIFQEYKRSFSLQENDNYTLYKLAMSVDIEIFLDYINASSLGKYKREIEGLKSQAECLGILHKQAPAILQGRDLIALGMQASKLFSQILNKAYDAQLHGEFSNHTEALAWLNKYLASH